MTQVLLITGTDTGVGKTVLTSALLAYWQTYRPQESCAIFKPIQSGQGDREWYERTFTLAQTPDEITPLQYEHPLAPPIAAALAGTSVDLGKVWQTYQHLQTRFDRIFIEGVGGLGTPLTPELTVADLARDWRLPLVLVVPVQLGAIGQTVANVALARQCNLDLQGLVLSCGQPRSAIEIEHLASPSLLESLTQVPVLGVLPFGPDLENPARLAQMATELMLERLSDRLLAKCPPIR